jgi:hypothetical protein
MNAPASYLNGLRLLSGGSFNEERFKNFCISE